MKIDHVGIAVQDLDAAVKRYQDLLGGSVTYEENAGWRSAIIKTKSGKLELMQPTDPDSHVGRFISKRGEGLHHLALEVRDIQACLDKAASIGISLIDEKPRKGSEDRLIAFMHPKSLNGVLLEFTVPS